MNYEVPKACSFLRLPFVISSLFALYCHRPKI